MKKMTLLLSAVLLTACSALAQTGDFDAFVNKYKAESGFSYALLSKTFFESTVKTELADDSDLGKLHNLVKELGALSVLVGDSIDAPLELYAEVRDMVPQADEYEDILSVKDGSDRVRMWVKTNDNTVKGLVLVVADKHDFVFVHFSGAIDLASCLELAKLMDSENTERLAQTAQNKTVECTVAPNPSSGWVTLETQKTDGAPLQLLVTDLQGKTVKSMTLNGGNTVKIDLSELKSGQYFLHIQTDKDKFAVKQIQIVR